MLEAYPTPISGTSSLGLAVSIVVDDMLGPLRGMRDVILAINSSENDARDMYSERSRGFFFEQDGQVVVSQDPL